MRIVNLGVTAEDIATKTYTNQTYPTKTYADQTYTTKIYADQTYTTKTYANQTYVKKIDSLPSFSVNPTDNVLDFINNNGVANKTIIIKCFGVDYIGEFHLVTSVMSIFEFELMGSYLRYSSNAQAIDLTGLTFGNIFSSAYQDNYALQSVVDDLTNDVTEIIDVIPSTASSSNQLVTQADVPTSISSTTVGFIIDTLHNQNNKYLSNYNAVDITISDYPGVQILYTGGEEVTGDICTQEQAGIYLKSMCGSDYVPTYNFDYPSYPILIDRNGQIYKPQWDSTNGLVLFKVTNPFLTQVAFADLQGVSWDSTTETLTLTI